VVSEVRLLGADSLGVSAAEGVVRERAGSALGMADHGGLEQGAVWQEVLGDLADEGDSLITSGEPPVVRSYATRARLAPAELSLVELSLARPTRWGPVAPRRSLSGECS
jgi:hypothetical protein